MEAPLGAMLAVPLSDGAGALRLMVEALGIPTTSPPKVTLSADRMMLLTTGAVSALPVSVLDGALKTILDAPGCV